VYILEHRQRHHQARQHALLDNPADTPAAAPQVHDRADPQLVLPGVVRVDQDLVGLPGRTARLVAESSAHAREAVQVDAGHQRKTGYRVVHRSDRHLDVRLLFDPVNQLLGQWSRTEAQGRSVGRPDDDVGADTPHPLLRIGQHALAQPHDGQHQSDFQADGDDAQRRADGPVLQVLDDEFVDQPTILCDGGSPW